MSRTKASILLKWETISEVDSLGFNVWRAIAPTNGECTGKSVEDYTGIVKLNEHLIHTTGKPSEGASHSYHDHSVTPQTVYCYGLEEITGSGERIVHWDLIIPAHTL